MTYRCGIDGALARCMGVEPGGPRITCDGCGVIFRIRENRPPPVWFLDGKAPPRWRSERNGDTRRDWCPACKVDRLVSHPATEQRSKP